MASKKAPSKPVPKKKPASKSKAGKMSGKAGMC